MPKKGRKIINIDEETYRKLDEMRRERNLISINDLLKELIKMYSGATPEKDPRTGDPMLDEEIKIVRELKICTAKKMGDSYLLDCGGRKAVVGKEGLKTLAEKLGLNIFISEK
jgi:predicted CopG family antitoxin